MKIEDIQRDALLRRHVCACLLALLVACAAGAAAEEFKIGGTGSVLATMRQLADEFTARNPDVRITTLPSLGSAGGIKAVIAGAIGLAVAARPLEEVERGLGAAEIEFARTPFVIAVSTKSGVSAITLREIADLYAGKTAAWADGSPVRIVLRVATDVDTELVKSISTEIRRAVEAAQARSGVRIAVTDQEAADDLERIPGAIGSMTLAQILSEQRALRALRLDGREPTAKNGAAGVYPYYKRLFLVIGAKRTAAVERFIAFVQSPAGLQILARNGQWKP